MTGVWKSQIAQHERILASGLEVYVDDSFQPGAAPPNPHAEVTSAKTAGSWSQLSSREATRKENEQKAAIFRGQPHQYASMSDYSCFLRAFALLTSTPILLQSRPFPQHRESVI